MVSFSYNIWIFDIFNSQKRNLAQAPFSFYRDTILLAVVYRLDM
ncbi:hypothetical protein ATL10_10611 [Bacillus sp. 196mf]|nr:hypothetical protein ATL10_10611 [Bacillus sp. 196mf]